ncbi:glucose uptake inhibitor SgrT [Yersinia nurmii]|uniref:Glucose uptake inhibitor SgrT n=2 Tax=Yersinia nurmii TaxID=685706 RepID=A0AAW7K3P8_9GAMM|nr:glucose uptake inhibitor SgrT [Yersinia nurmii]MDN0088172.1 glucose uptake inhibitor SgrT [Yersinia nurmii]
MMKKCLTRQFYQRYFRAIRQQQADWLSWVPMEWRLRMLADVTQWDIQQMPEKEYRKHI